MKNNPTNSQTSEISSKKKVFYYFLMFVFILTTVELGLHTLLVIKGFGSRHLSKVTKLSDKTKKRRIKIVDLSAYTETSWGDEYWYEFRKAKSYEYYPFIEWRRKEFQGKYVNVSADGIRWTWNPAIENEQEIKRVYVFGGSAIFGAGVRDNFTIPSLLSKKLNEQQNKYFVVNYGETAYTLTQEIVYLILLLKKGELPDYVIFYDGTNDTAAANQSGMVGSINNLHKMRDKFTKNKGKPISNFDHIRKGLAGIIRDNSMIYRTLFQAQSNIVKNKRIKGKGASAIKPFVASSYNDDELTLLSEEIVSDYVNSVNLIKSLSKMYGFKYILFWQPVLYTKAHISDEELTYKKGWRDKRRMKLFKKVYKIMETKRIEHFYNISTIFNAIKSTMFIDFWHITEQGNEIVSNEIYDIFKKEDSASVTR